MCFSLCLSLFFFKAPATTQIYTLSLHDALPISQDTWQATPRLTVYYGLRYMYQTPWNWQDGYSTYWDPATNKLAQTVVDGEDRKSTRLNSSHVEISYAVFCLKKKKKRKKTYTTT